MRKIKDYLYEISKEYRYDMQVPARIYVDEKLLADVLQDRSLEQAINVATLPGIYKYSLAMPDIHQGYGFPIGGVAAFSLENGVISPGGVGYDINCGVRLLKANCNYQKIQSIQGELAHNLLRHIPSGVGRGGKVKTKGEVLDQVLRDGASWAVKNGYGVKEDLKNIEENGCLRAADPNKVSEQAKKRGADQVGTLGSGNHFIEVQRVSEIYSQEIANKFGLFKNQIAIMIHTGSRGLGHQVCTDYIRKLQKYIIEKNIKPADRELIYAPFGSALAEDYLAAMSAAANFAWANRQVLAHLAQEVFAPFGINLETLYDVAHNIAKIEEHDNKKLCVHRKGATRAFPGQPVLIPGSMGTASYVLQGTKQAMQESFGSVCHGAGRVMSRRRAKQQAQGKALQQQLKEQGILVESYSMRGLAEEAPLAYKDIHNVVDVVAKAGLAEKVAQLKPLIVIKGD